MKEKLRKEVYLKKTGKINATLISQKIIVNPGFRSTG